MSKKLVILSLAIVGLSLACARTTPSAVPGGPALGAIALRDEANHDEPLAARAARANVTVLLFFSADCPVQKAHDLRIRELVDGYKDRGVAFYAVVSEVGADLAAERAAAKQRGLE